LKILYLNPNGTIGGAERVLVDLLRAVRQECPDWNLELIAGAEGELAAAARAIPITVRVLPFPRSVGLIGDAAAGGPAGNFTSRRALLARLALSAPSLAVYVWRLRSFLVRCGAHLIHSNGFKTHIVAAHAAPPHTRLIWHVHDYVQSRPLMSRLMRIHSGRCALAIANSRSVARDLKPVWGERPSIRVVHNAVDLERFNPEGPCLDLDALAGLPPAADGTVRVGMIATMARWKGQEVFLQALSMLSKEQSIRGYLIGGPVYTTNGSQYTLDELRTVARNLGIERHVGFTGHVREPAAAIRTLDVAVHASTQPEPFGMAVAEAMACGKPVVASRTGGVVEIIADNETALSHLPGDAPGAASCIGRLVCDRELRMKLGQRARHWAEQRLDLSRLVGEMVPIYKSIAGP
jgi:glycosyltransferase involved in cell wall biosynthesis